MKKYTITIIVVILALVGIFAMYKKTEAPTPPIIVPVISGNTSDLISLSIKPGNIVTEGETITGAIKGGYFFEAQAHAELLDENKNHMTQFPISATSDWMTSGPVDFKMSISYAVDDKAITKGTGYIRMENDNPSGDPSKDKYIDIPVVFQ